MAAWAGHTVEIAGSKMFLSRGGQGKPLVVLHHDIGTPDRLDFYDRLAARFDVIVPHHPGWNKSERPQWLRSVRDVAVMYRQLFAALDLREQALVGLGFGGWIAAELSAMAPREVSHLALVGAMGIRPPEGFILDQALMSYIAYVKAGLHDRSTFERMWGAEPPLDVLEQWDINREMCFRIAWKPYMYSQTLPHLLKDARMPALVAWGDDDGIVPVSAGHAYAKALPNARLEILKSCGHFAELERPAELAHLISSFAA
jgi:pimeloyl-ACP methyl ester carboxylesterase